MVPAASPTRLRPAWTLIRRARWLILLLILAYAYSLPGEPLLPILGGLSPTHEGGMHGLVQAWRLAVLLLLLDALVLRMPAHDLLTGVHAVLKPLAWFGLDPRRAALRLALTMQAMERPRGWQALRGLLAGDLPGEDLPAEYVLAIRPFRAIDWLALFGLFLLAGLWLTA